MYLTYFIKYYALIGQKNIESYCVSLHCISCLVSMKLWYMSKMIIVATHTLNNCPLKNYHLLEEIIKLMSMLQLGMAPMCVRNTVFTL